MLKVLQLIDSLDAGGAERVAVNIANELALKGHASHLCVTRKEGLLKSQIDSKVFYSFLNKKGTIDIKVFRKLSSYVRDYNIGIIHAHSTSFFLASMIKLRHPKLKLVWHDHYGNSETLKNRPSRMLKMCRSLFDHVIAVNEDLQLWSVNQLGIKKALYLKNFAVVDKEVALSDTLPGVAGKRIVHLANFRSQKDHLNLLKAFLLVKETIDDWSLLLVGKSFNDEYFEEIVQFVSTNHLEDSVFILGSRMDAHAILRHCDLGVLSSQSEGLPLALIEYGLSGLPVVATDVGASKAVIDDYGELVPASDAECFAKALKQLIRDNELREKMGSSLQQHVKANFGSRKYISELERIYDRL